MQKAKKGEKSVVLTIVKTIVSVFVLALQILTFYFIYSGSVLLFNYFTIGSRILQLTTFIYILYRHDKITYKLAWIVFIAFLPIAGVLIYLLWGRNRLSKRMKKARRQTIEKSHHLLPSDEPIVDEIENQDRQISKQVHYLRNVTKYPVYKNEGVEYFETGEKYFDSLINDLKKAKKYILIEYFIIAKGNLWSRVFEVLKEKVAAGVKIQILVDGWGTVLRYPRNIVEEAKALGINIIKYNPITYGLNNYMNYRDHRKITVIDGIIAYTGGVNMADEYINEQIRFGHWKDTGIKVVGTPCLSFTIAFLKNLEIASKKESDYKWYINNSLKQRNNNNESSGYNLFFTDGPDNRKNPGENVYIQMLNMAKDYVYIFTPYFIPSSEMLTAIINASSSGVDVRIITPYKPDKWYVHISTRSYYEVLIRSGVKVYEYLPGFLHAKSFVSDDNVAVVGSLNVDFRSLNLNYECASWMYNTGVEKKIKQDFINTMNKSKIISLENAESKNIFVKILEAIINAFSPML